MHSDSFMKLSLPNNQNPDVSELARTRLGILVITKSVHVWHVIRQNDYTHYYNTTVVNIYLSQIPYYKKAPQSQNLADLGREVLKSKYPTTIHLFKR